MRPLLLAALLCGAPQSPAGRAIEVGGLKAGESAVAVDGAGIRHSDAELWVNPRFLDATTGKPLEGVTVELHQEDEGVPPNSETLVLTRTSAVDGGVHVPLVTGARRADKVRLSKPGYESTTLDAGDLFDGDVALFRALALEGRVLDLDGAPIPGAIVRTRYTCKHAVPAVQTTTDAEGGFRFADFPSIARPCDVEVLASEHGARADWDSMSLIRERGVYGAIELRLPRRLPFELTVLDVQGKPLAGRRVVNLVAPLASEVTDERGHVILPPLAGGRWQAFQVEDAAGQLQLEIPCIAQFGETRTRPIPAPRGDADDDAPRGKLAIRLTGVPEDLDPAEAPLLQIVDAGGNVVSGPGPHALRAGPASVQVGAAFSGWREVVSEVTIEEGLNEFGLSAEREPALEVRLPPFEYASLFVQAGDDSITLEDARTKAGAPLRVHVPPDEPLVLWLEASSGERRRLALAPLHGDAVARLDEEKCVVRAAAPKSSVQTAKVRIEARDASGAPIRELNCELQTPSATEQIYHIAESAVDREVVRGGSFAARLSAEGFRDAWVIGTVPLQGAPDTVNVVLTRRALLTFAGDVVAVEAAGPDPAVGEDGWTVEAAPGPLLVRAQRKDGSVIALQLQLADGEERRIEIPRGAREVIALLLAAALAFQDPKPQAPLALGVDVLLGERIDLVRGKRVGLITNPAGVDRTLVPTADRFARDKRFTLALLFGPEHGIRGDAPAGDAVGDQVDAATGVPVVSLYGKSRRPGAEALAKIDVLVFDLQDVGSRTYTYISTLGEAMRACADAKKPLIVLDRPNPLGGLAFDGPLCAKEQQSFVGWSALPLVHGMTAGEVARFYASELGIDCPLEVVAMRGWKRAMVWQDTGLTWVPTSPHIPHALQAELYVCTGMVASTLANANDGVGTPLPFELSGAAFVDGAALKAELDRLRLPGLSFRAASWQPFYGKFAQQQLYGVQLLLDDPHALQPVRTALAILCALQKLYGPKLEWEAPATAARFWGTPRVVELLRAGKPADEIEASWRAELARFAAVREKALLYKD